MKDRLKSIEFIFDGGEGALVRFIRQKNTKPHSVDIRGFRRLLHMIDELGLCYTKTKMRYSYISISVSVRTL